MVNKAKKKKKDRLKHLRIFHDTKERGQTQIYKKQWLQEFVTPLVRSG